MAQAILELKNLTKTYILGPRKNAQKAREAIQKFEKHYEKLADKGDAAKTKAAAKKLETAQQLFTNEEYEKSYQTITGKHLKPRRKDRGTVVHALRGINLKIMPGELVAVVGPSGSGKSTLLNMLGLLDKPTSGRIAISGTNVSHLSKRDLPDLRSKQLGFVFQSFNLIPTLTALENVELPLRYAGIGGRTRRQRARTALEQIGLGDRLNHRSTELSGGQRQRVAIARSIVNNPAIIFGDELTGELDSKMTAEIMRLIVKLNQTGQTFIIVTHNPEVASLCRRTIIMKDGRIEKEVNHGHKQLG